MEIHELIPEGPWDEDFYDHNTESNYAQIGNSKAETIDITPVGCQTPEGNARVLQAHQEWDSATHLLANTVKQFFDAFEDPIRGLFLVDASLCEELHQLRALIGARDRKQEAFLRAVCGQPHRPEKPKLKTYPATVNGKTVQVTIPED